MEEIRLYHGDCLKLMKDIPDESVDMILTDPPYGVTQCKWDNVQPFEPMWEEYRRIIKPNGCIAIFAGEPFSSALVQSNLKMYRYELIWKKNVEDRCGYTTRFRSFIKRLQFIIRKTRKGNLTIVDGRIEKVNFMVR